MSELLSIYKTLKSKKWVNLSHKIDEKSPKFPVLPALEKETLFTAVTHVLSRLNSVRRFFTSNNFSAMVFPPSSSSDPEYP